MEVELLSIAFADLVFIYYQAYPEMIKGALLSDAIVIFKFKCHSRRVRRVSGLKILD
jgi:hypothetical protein